MTVFTAGNISKRYINHQALDSVSIDVPEGSIFGLLGPNGAGKTTLIRIINRIIAPDKGTLLFRGDPMKRNDIHRIGYLPEERGLYKKMKVGEQALYLSQLKGLSKQDAIRRLRYWFEKFSLLEWWDRKVEELSKGMQQKVQFIVTIVHEPELLIFDEPFSGFDPINVNLLKDEILGLKEKGSTIIFSTHNMASVEELCDHIALINNSRKILDGKVKDIRNQYKANIYEISFNGFSGYLKDLFAPDDEVLSETTDEDLRVARVRLAEGKKANDMLNMMLPHAEIHSFHEVLPTMNDIFISKVNEKRGS